MEQFLATHPTLRVAPRMAAAARNGGNSWISDRRPRNMFDFLASAPKHACIYVARRVHVPARNTVTTESA
eukprot:10588259-Lingulodinium_polyedra.AAC.1